MALIRMYRKDVGYSRSSDIVTTHSFFDKIFQVNSISHEGVVSANVWFVNILIIISV